MSFSNSFARQTINFGKLIGLSLITASQQFLFSYRFWKLCRARENPSDLARRENIVEDSPNSTLTDRKCYFGS